MSEVSSSDWSETDNSNTAATPNGWPEGQTPGSVNNCARAMMGALKRFWGRINGEYASTGSSNAYVLSPTVDLAAYVTGERYSFRANFANTGSATLNISSLGAKTIKKFGNGATSAAALTGGEIQNGQTVTVEYDGTDLILVTPSGNGVENINALTADSSPSGTADYVATWDASASAHKKVLLNKVGSWVLLDTQTASSSAGLDFETGIDSTFDEYVFVITNLLPATDATALTMRFSTDGGSTYAAGASDYAWGIAGFASDNTAANLADTADTQIRIDSRALSNVSNEFFSGEIRVTAPAAGGGVKAYWRAGWVAAAAQEMVAANGAGRYVGATDAVDGVRFLMSSGNIASGTIRLYGIRK